MISDQIIGDGKFDFYLLTDAESTLILKADRKQAIPLSYPHFVD